ncbi:phosphatidylethanolamine-binding protein (PEBP) family uncharacterized protein [Mycoplasmoides fastidiosum]|uniref:Phosphatidylethanolamine-binding protein (PEBP) family uncharacterized protein n=1 Tax=Mycoplasmoides fastidiosum TaxID=92758 RepID=A0ABU0LYY2_9BACT|nr:hypothetical protein [Mycoplasmoides fastidiosum]MDQ0513916.1 phosphatidylethanolamine-binding protein (PEBP) family uncharacterized protein [Mycoplasmoides fastidiosum]UUD37670.1 hypothetical protein NPA10_03825 [Mycoplasmoides fastidiosum]
MQEKFTKFLTSNSIDENHVINARLNTDPYRSLHLKWAAIENAAAYAVVLMDKDASGAMGVPFLHWAALVLDPNITELDENASAELGENVLFQFENSTTKNVQSSIIPAEFLNDNARNYFGPTPPENDHLYEVVVIGLREKPDTDHLPYPQTFALFEEIVLKSDPIKKYSLYFVGRQVKFQNGYISLANPDIVDPHLKDGGHFYVSETASLIRIQNLQIKDLIKTESGNFLDRKYFTILKWNAENPLSVGFKSFKRIEFSFDKVADAQSYVVLLNNSQSLNIIGTPLVNWTGYSIFQPEGDRVVVDQQTHLFNTVNSYSAEILNSGRPSLFAQFGKDGLITEKEKKLFAARNLFGGGYFVELSDTYSTAAGFYTLFVYATDLAPQAYPELKTQQDLLHFINNHVVATAELKFKIK